MIVGLILIEIYLIVFLLSRAYTISLNLVKKKPNYTTVSISMVLLVLSMSIISFTLEMLTVVM